MDDKQQKRLEKYKQSFAAMSNEELAQSTFDQQGNPGWPNSRALFMTAQKEELEKRKLQQIDEHIAIIMPIIGN